MQILRADSLKILTVWPSPPPLHLYGFKKALREAWKAEFGCKCPSCKNEMSFINKDAKNYATIDHIIARALGGNDNLHNIQIICKKCNNEKSKREGFIVQYDPLPILSC